MYRSCTISHNGSYRSAILVDDLGHDLSYVDDLDRDLSYVDDLDRDLSNVDGLDRDLSDGDGLDRDLSDGNDLQEIVICPRFRLNNFSEMCALLARKSSKTPLRPTAKTVEG